MVHRSGKKTFVGKVWGDGMSYELFKGYVKTKNKKCTQAYKGKRTDELLKLNEARALREYAGVLNDEVILIDIDNKEESDVLFQIVDDLELRCRVYQTTRGKHFLFLNNGVERATNGAMMACGLKADYKLGSKSGYEILKYNDSEREIIYDILPDEDYQAAPKWLHPVKGAGEWKDMEAGDGRNQKFFNYILTLQSAGFTKEQVRECINVINTYVVAEPLPEKELDTVMRDEAFKKQTFFSGNTFLFDKFAKYMQSQYHVVRISGYLHIYRDGVYVPDAIEPLMIQEISMLSARQRAEVVAYLEVLIDKSVEPAPAKYIAFKNGIYDIETSQMQPFDPALIITNKIPWDYVEGAYSQFADDALNRIACNDPQVRDLLEEVIGYTFYRRNELRKGFILKGKRGNGKSTFIDMIATLLGPDNICSLDLKEIGSQFRTYKLYGKLCNIGDDIDDNYIATTSVLKKAISGERITVERKGKDPFEVSPYSKHIFSANSIPRMGRGRDSEAIIDRFIIIPLEAKFNLDAKGFDPFIKYKLRSQECMEYLIQIGIAGIKRVLSRREFTTTEKIKEELVEFAESNNPILLFFKDCADEIINHTTTSAYQKYDSFCIENNYQKCTQIEFTKQVKQYFGCDVKVRRINKKSTRIYVKEE